MRISLLCVRFLIRICSCLKNGCAEAGVKAHATVFFFNDTKQIKETFTISLTTFLAPHVCDATRYLTTYLPNKIYITCSACITKLI